MKQVTKKVRNGIIDRFLLSANELPHSISYLSKKDGWLIFECKSANYIMKIAHKELFNQFIKWA